MFAIRSENVGDEVGDCCQVFQCDERMPQSRFDEDRVVFVAFEYDAVPLAKRRGPLADVHDIVDDRTRDRHHVLGLSGWHVRVMNAPNDAAR